MFLLTALNQYWERVIFGLAIGLYFLFGMYHLAQFETTDEHFWKYERIPQYWEALQTGNLKKTAINDKPGITVALTSGVGLLFENPLQHRLRDEQITQDGALTVYDTTLTERINWALRLPILVMNGFLIVLSFFLLKKIFPQGIVPILTVILIALSPTLVGISQIINPDALLWSCSWIGFLSVLVFLQKYQWKYIFLAGIFTGLSLLSKYTANVLFPLILSLLFTYPLWNEAWKARFFSLKNYLQVTVKTFAALLILAHITFALGMPAVFQKPEKLFDGIFGFWHSMHIDWLLITPLLLITIDGFFLQGQCTAKLIRLTTSWKPVVLSSLRWSLFFPLLFFGSLFFLSLGEQSFLPLNTILMTAKEDGELAFPLLSQYPVLLAPFIKLLVAAYPFFVSIHPLLWCLLFLGWIIHIKQPAPSLHTWLTLSLSWFSLVYFAAALTAGVLTNVRYSIILFPLFALLFALSYEALWRTIRISVSNQQNASKLLILFVLLALTSSLFFTKPFYLNYTSPLVSRHIAPHDAWGYGQYEAAQWLNTLPNAENLLIWSDRNGICQFLNGPKCIAGYKIDQEKTRPDYFVISKRGGERGYVPRDKATGTVLLSRESLDRDALWRLNILDRPDNFILITPSHLAQ